MNPVAQSLTDDSLFRGLLFCRQPSRGYRFSVDSVLAAHFATPGADDWVLDLGCGSGVIGLILAHRFPSLTLTGLEVQADLAALARDNVRANGFHDRCTIVHGDVRAMNGLVSPESMELVVCNPPYRKCTSGRHNGHDQVARARHELDGTVDDFIRAAAFAVKNRGRVVFVYPAARCASLVAALVGHRLVPKRLQPVYSYPEANAACLVLLESRKNGGEGLDILSPFYIYRQKNGPYTLAMERLYQGEACLPG